MPRAELSFCMNDQCNFDARSCNGDCSIDVPKIPTERTFVSASCTARQDPDRGDYWASLATAQLAPADL